MGWCEDAGQGWAQDDVSASRNTPSGFLLFLRLQILFVPNGEENVHTL